MRAHDGIHEQIVAVTRQIQKDPHNAALYLQRGELYRLHRDWAAATADYDSAKLLAPDLRIVDFARGRMFYEMGDHGRAIKVLDGFLATEPGHVEARLTRAKVFFALKQMDRATEDYTRVIDLVERPDPDWYAERARAQVAGGRKTEALAGLEAGVERLGKGGPLDLLALDLEVELGQYDAALTRIERLQGGSQRKETWLERKGQVFERAGRLQEARQAYEAAIAAIESLPEHVRSRRTTKELATRLQKRLKALGRQ